MSHDAGNLRSIHLPVTPVRLPANQFLTGHLDDAEIASLVAESESAEDACRRLVATALDRGGHDNVTVVAARFG